jgi:hypothetical protein
MRTVLPSVAPALGAPAPARAPAGRGAKRGADIGVDGGGRSAGGGGLGAGAGGAGGAGGGPGVRADRAPVALAAPVAGTDGKAPPNGGDAPADVSRFVVDMPEVHYNSTRLPGSDRLDSSDVELTVHVSPTFVAAVKRAAVLYGDADAGLASLVSCEVLYFDGTVPSVFLEEECPGAPGGLRFSMSPLPPVDVHSCALNERARLLSVHVCRRFPISSAHAGRRFLLCLRLGDEVVVSRSFIVLAKKAKVGTPPKLRFQPELVVVDPRRAATLALMSRAVAGPGGGGGGGGGGGAHMGFASVAGVGAGPAAGGGGGGGSGRGGAASPWQGDAGGGAEEEVAVVDASPAPVAAAPTRVTGTRSAHQGAGGGPVVCSDGGWGPKAGRGANSAVAGGGAAAPGAFSSAVTGTTCSGAGVAAPLEGDLSPAATARGPDADADPDSGAADTESCASCGGCHASSREGGGDACCASPALKRARCNAGARRGGARSGCGGGACSGGAGSGVDGGRDAWAPDAEPHQAEAEAEDFAISAAWVGCAPPFSPFGSLFGDGRCVDGLAGLASSPGGPDANGCGDAAAVAGGFGCSGGGGAFLDGAFGGLGEPGSPLAGGALEGDDTWAFAGSGSDTLADLAL